MLPSRPDLDPLPDPPETSARSRWHGALAIGAVAVVGGAFGFLLGEVLDGIEVGGATLLAAVVLGIPAVLAVHELGHVAGGQLAGWRFAMLIVGPLRVERKNDDLRWSLNKSVALSGGLALSLPTTGASTPAALRRQSALVVAGGPVASVLLGVIGLAVGGAWAVVGTISLGIAAVTLFPGRTSGFLTDGARLLRLIRGGALADREAALLAVLAEMMSGVRPRDWDRDLLEAAAVLEDGDPMETSARTLAMSHALDSGDAQEARRHLVRRIELWAETPSAIRGGVASDAALFEAAIRGDGARARAWVDRVPARSALADPASDALGRAATLRAEGDLEAARAAAEESRAALEAPLAAGSAEAMREWLSEMGL